VVAASSVVCGVGDFAREDAFSWVGIEGIGRVYIFSETFEADFDRIEALSALRVESRRGDLERTEDLVAFAALSGCGDFERGEVFSTSGVGGSGFLGEGTSGGGKSAAVVSAEVTGGKPAALSSSAL
jgi:hypothetical protein